MSDALTSQELQVWADLRGALNLCLIEAVKTNRERLRRLADLAWRTPIPPPRGAERMRLFHDLLMQARVAQPDFELLGALAQDCWPADPEPPPAKPYYLRDDDD